MENARCLGACALVEVARVLVQKGWQDGTADHDGAYAVGSASAIALTVGSPTLAVVGNVRCLVDSGKHTHPDEGSRIGRGSEGELEFQHEVAGQMVAGKVGPGGVLYVAFGTRHTVKNAGTVPARYFVVAIGGDAK